MNETNVHSASLEDLQRAIADKERALSDKENKLLSLYGSTKSATGERVVQPHQAESIRELEGQAAALTDQLNAMKLDWMEARTRANLERRARESVGPPIHKPGGGGPGDALAAVVDRTPIPDTLGDGFVSSPAYKSWVHGGQGQRAHIEVPLLNMRDYALKATLTTATGPFTSILKEPTVIQLGQQALTVADLFAQAQTNNTTIRYIREDTFTNAAAMVAEEGLKPEATWDLSEVDQTVKKIAVVTKVTTEMFEDYPAIRDYINDRLPFMVRQREELQLLSGDGTGNNLLGILNVPGILTQAKSTFSNIDAIYLAMTKVRTQGFFEPDAIVIDPTNWSPIRLLKTTTGEYVYGDPALPGPETIFGKRVVVTANMVDNTALVGAFRIGGTIYYRTGLRIEATNSDQNDFIYNRIALRAEQREAGVVCWRPKAFCTVTGLDFA